MKFECEKCRREATVHLTEITNGQKIERHLCEECASAEGITIKAQMPISKIIEELMLQSSAEKEFSTFAATFAGFRSLSSAGTGFWAVRTITRCSSMS